MIEATARLGLPMIQPGQAQKEASHNEALALLDLCVQPVAVAVGSNTPPAAPAPGQSWVVGGTPVGAWLGQANTLAGWTENGWRFVAPVIGMTVAVAAAGFARWNGTAWVEGELLGQRLILGGEQVVGERRPAIADPTGGTSPDIEARTAVAAILHTLREHGLIFG